MNIELGYEEMQKAIARYVMEEKSMDIDYVDVCLIVLDAVESPIDYAKVLVKAPIK